MIEEFLEIATQLQGIIVGGPGHTKFDFVDGGYITDQLKRKILGIKDLSYTGEFGLRELVEKSEDILSEEEVVAEKLLMRQFFETLSKEPTKVSYGFNDVLRHTNMGAVDKLLVSEDLDESSLTTLEESAKLVGTTIEIIGVETEEGAQLKAMGAVAALLRYPVDD